MHAPSPASPADAIRIAELIDRIGRQVRAGRAGHGLKRLHWECLRFLARANRFSRHPAGIAAGLGITRGAASQTVEALAKLGLVLRLPDPGDGRARALDLTNAGRRMVAEDPLLAAARAIASLPAETLAATAAGLAAAGAAIDRATGGATTGTCATCMHFEPEGGRNATGGRHRCARMEAALNEAETALLCVLYEETGR